MLVFSKWDQKLSEKLLCIFHSIPFDRARDSVLFVETASVVTGTFLTAQSASLYSDSVMNWCCDCQPCLTLTEHNLHQTLYTIICQPCLTLTTQCASDSLHCHLSAMSDTDCTQSASDSLHCLLSAMSDTALSASDSLHCHLSVMTDTDYTICIWLFTLSWTDAETVRHVWHWLCTLWLSGLSDAQESTKQSLVLDRRRLVFVWFWVFWFWSSLVLLILRDQSW